MDSYQCMHGYTHVNALCTYVYVYVYMYLYMHVYARVHVYVYACRLCVAYVHGKGRGAWEEWLCTSEAYAKNDHNATQRTC